MKFSIKAIVPGNHLRRWLWHVEFGYFQWDEGLGIVGRRLFRRPLSQYIDHDCQGDGDDCERRSPKISCRRSFGLRHQVTHNRRQLNNARLLLMRETSFEDFGNLIQPSSIVPTPTSPAASS